MAVQITQMLFYKSSTTLGGVASLGGGINTGALLSAQNITIPAALTGVTLLYAVGFTLGTGTFSFVAATSTLTWTPPTPDAAANSVVLSGNGDYLLRSGSAGSQAGYAVISVFAVNLPTSDVSGSGVVTNVANNLWDDLDKTRTLAGETSYRCVYLKNTNTVDSGTYAALWIDADTPGADTLAIGLDTNVATWPATTGSATSLSTNQYSVPAGVAFSSPMNETAAIPLSVVAGVPSTLANATFVPDAYIPVWIRRTCPSGVATSTPLNTSMFKFTLLV